MDYQLMISTENVIRQHVANRKLSMRRQPTSALFCSGMKHLFSHKKVLKYKYLPFFAEAKMLSHKELFDVVPEEYLSHKERYENAIRKVVMMYKLLMKYQSYEQPKK